jgi:eukaryotic-like serine/threonine-protein kinase
MNHINAYSRKNTEMTLNTGFIVKNRYRIVTPIGQGGMAIVYRAWDLHLEKPIALKEMTVQPDIDAETLAQLRLQFQNEARTVAKLDHPNLVKVTDFFEENNKSYFVMEYVDGTSLSDLIENQGALSEQQVLSIANQILEALIYCHQQGIVHRDIKPENIILQADERVKLVDFGLLKLWDAKSPHTQKVIQGIGTPEYAPPEQYGIHPSSTDPRSDIYSLGATLYHALTGQAPPSVTDRMAFPAQFQSLDRISTHLSPQVRNVVGRAMQVTPEERFQTAQEMQAALKSTLVLQQANSHAYSKQGVYQPLTAPPPPDKRRRNFLIITGVILILVLASAYGLWSTFYQDQSDSRAVLPEAESVTENMPSENEPATETLLAQAEHYFLNEQYDEAAVHYQAVLEENPDSVEARQGLAWSYYYQSQYQLAIPEFDKLGNASPVDSFKGQSLSYIGLQWHEDALPMLQRWSELEPTAFEVHKQLGLTYAAMDNLEEAARHFRRWDQLSDDETEAISAKRHLGQALLDLEAFEEAKQTFEQLVTLSPEMEEAYEGLGTADFRLGNTQEALETYQQWVGLSPESAEAHAAVGRVARDTEDLALSIESYQTALAIEERYNWYTNLGLALVLNEQFEAALEAYQRSWDLNPEQVDPYRLAGWLYLQRFEDYEEAIIVFRQAARYAEAAGLTEADVSIYTGMGSSYRALGQHRQAIAPLRTALELSPDSVNVNRSLALSYFALQGLRRRYCLFYKCA